MTLGEKIKKFRKEQGLTQEEMAVAFRIDRSTVASWETDRALPDINTIKKLAERFHVSIDYLVDHQVDKVASNPLTDRISDLSEENQKLVEKMIRLLENEEKDRKEGL